MIQVEFYRNTKAVIWGFRVANHGDPLVCSAVSALVLNTVNSIEAFTKEQYSCNYLEEGGYMEVKIPCLQKNTPNHDVELLLNSLYLGIRGIAEEYGNEIHIVDQEV